MTEQKKCKYKQTYTYVEIYGGIPDFLSQRSEIYECTEPAVRDGYCIFHHPEYWKEHKEEVKEKFMEKVEEAVHNNKPLLCIGCHLPEIDLSGIHFNVPVFFDHTVFHEQAIFDRATFTYVSFSESTFEEKAIFSGAQFNEAIFDGAFFSDADFRFAKLEDTRFDGTVFKTANFNKADIKDVRFDNTKFEKAVFQGGIFKNSEFTEVIFNEADFAGAWAKGISFINTLFNKADFKHFSIEDGLFGFVTFEEADFSESEFFGEETFLGVRFSNRAIFDKAHFHGRVEFLHTSFQNEASFIEADFSPDKLEKSWHPRNFVAFRHTRFEKQEKVVFDGCRMARVSFIGTEIDRVKFRNVDWGNFKIYDEKLLLLKLSEKERKKFIKEEKRKLKKILEIPSDKILNNVIKNQSQSEIDEKEVKEIAEEIRLRDKIQMVFPEEKDEKGKNTESIYQALLEKYKNEIKEILEKEDQELEKDIMDYLAKDKDLTLDNVLAVYRGLRENYDYYLRYDESGKFFVNEMKLKKRFAGPLEKIVLWTYELLALYGESYTRPIAWTLIIIPTFALLRTINFSLQGFISHISQLLYTPLPVILSFDTLLGNLKTSTEIFFQLHYDDNPLTLVERLVSIPILSSLSIALVKRLKQRI
jgi:uncharacterized protein YjbI with pentapeptide repeats/succinate dehydrogenase flavin-adding protein (antitoxin of CptAB toxin-antitoxin module)